jgi:hypothetical protein
MADETVLRIGGEGRHAGTFHRAIKKEPPGPGERDYLWYGPCGRAFRPTAPENS